jgi:hypothetical protein
MPALPASVGEDSIPLARIVRYAVYAIAIFAVGAFVATVVGNLLGFLRFALYPLSEPLTRLFIDGVELLEDGLRLFAVLVGVGVFLSQFEKG